MSTRDFMVVSYGYETMYGFFGGGLERIKKDAIIEFSESRLSANDQRRI